MSQKQFWLNDPDISPAHPALVELIARTGVEDERIYDTSLAALAGKLHETAGRRKMWVLQRGEWAGRPLFGMQFCGSCLADDARPYYRRWWRLSLAVSCPHHGQFLSDRCPRCEAPVRLHLAPAGSSADASKTAIALCHDCGFDFRKAPPPREVLFDPSELHRLQTFYHKSLVDGFVELPGYGTIQYSFLFFHMVWNLLNKVHRVKLKSARQLADELRKELSLPAQPTADPGAEFEALPGNERRILLWMVSFLLDRWPDRFVGFCRRANLTSSDFDKIKRVVPYWFAKTLREELAFDFTPGENGSPSMSKRLVAQKFLTKGNKGYLAFRRRMEIVRSRKDLWNSPSELAAALVEQGFYVRGPNRSSNERRALRLVTLARETGDDEEAWKKFFHRKKRSV